MYLNRSVRSHVVSLSCCFMLAAAIGCQQEDMTPVQTSADELDQYLLDNPNEAYSSDDLESAIATDEQDGEGNEGSAVDQEK